ncbi:MAG: hypothetical protein HYY30_02700 [Chloroflexi bacterium]|nr:hypothetical protein [Chloroflexota bacterium]
MNELIGTGALIRLILRRDRVWLPLWIVTVALVPIGFTASAQELYPTAEALKALADESMKTPAAIVMLGRIFSPTLGGIVAWRTGLQGAILIAPASILFVIRHTRTEEEKGRRELLGATVVGRQASLTAALIVVFGANLAIATLIAAGLVGLGLPVAGSIAFGLSAAAGGWVFAAVAGMAAQLTQSPGAARGIALLVFGLLYVLRAPSDLTEGSWLSWLSPVGWLRQTRAFAGEQWWVFALLGTLVVVLMAAAFALSARRDLGAGLLPSRLGPAAAGARLGSPLALAWRLQRGALLAWAAAFAALGVGLGAISPSISKMVDVPEIQAWVARMGARDAGDAFLFMSVYILGQVASAYGIAATLRLRSEEVELRAEPVLAASVSRLRWASGHLVFGVIGPIIVLAALGIPIGLINGWSTGEVGYQLPRLLARTLVTLPAIWIMVGLATASYGFAPRFARFVTWAALATFLALEFAWEVQQVSRSIFNISPFAHVHWSVQVTSESLVGLTVLASALTIAGLIGFRRRDLA